MMVSLHETQKMSKDGEDIHENFVDLVQNALFSPWEEKRVPDSPERALFFVEYYENGCRCWDVAADYAPPETEGSGEAYHKWITSVAHRGDLITCQTRQEYDALVVACARLQRLAAAFVPSPWDR